MGTSQSRDGARILESDDEEPSPRSNHLGLAKTIAHEYGLDVRMSGLSLDDQSLSPAKGKPSVKLYHYVSSKEDGKGHWIVAEKLTPWEFVRENDLEEEDEEEEEDENEEVEEDEADRRFKDGFRRWILVVGKRVRSFVSERLQMRFKDDEFRVDFVFQGVWALKFYMKKDYEKFVSEYRNCLFENTYYLEATDSNKTKVFGKDFVNWVKPQEGDESVWEDAQDSFAKPPAKDSKSNDPKETYTESAEGRIQSLTMGAFDNSFLVSSSGVEAFRNTPTGLHGKGMSVQFKDDTNVGSQSSKKGMLIRGESNMVVFSPTKENRRATGVRRLDLEAGKTVSEWKFEKDGTPITMRDVTNDSKASQLDASGSTFLGLDDNRLCRWDIRDKQGIVQDLAEPVLRWTEGHQFSRGTNFQCFASTGDGCIAVGSKDGKIRLYGNSSMRQAKTAFPGLGSAITAIDATFDGKWVLATTDNYLILINTTFKDKDGELKTGFTGRMGNKISAPRLLKLTPIDAYLAGENQKFHNGKFSWVTENRKEEHHLVVSVGKFTVIWDFKRVKDSSHSCYKNSEGLKSCYCYMVVPKEESIVESTFMHDNFNAVSTPEAPLVVATPKKLSSFNV